MKQVKPPRRTTHLWVLAPLGLATVLGAHRLAAKSLWWDEGFSMWLARLDWESAWQSMRTAESNMLLYYLLLRAWLQLGHSEVVIRSLSTVAAVACVVPFYCLGVRILGARYALLASFFLASNAFFVRYAQEARGYSLVLLLTITSSLFFLRAVERPTGWRLAGYAVVSALAVYAHFFAVWVLAAQFFAAMLRSDRQRFGVRLIGAQAAVAAAVAPLAVVASRRHGALFWVPRPSVSAMVDFGNELTGYGGLALTLLYLLLGATFLVRHRWPPRIEAERDFRWQQTFLVIWLALPVIGSLVVSWLITPVFYGRFLLVALPPLPLLAAGGIQALQPRWTRLVAVVAVLGLAFVGLQRWYMGFPKEGWRAAAAYVVSRAKPADAIAFLPLGGRWPGEYYLDQLRPRGIPLVPVWPAAAWGALKPSDPDLTQQSTDSWTDRLNQQERLWVVQRATGPRRTWAAIRDLPSGYCAQEGRSFYRVRVSLYISGAC